MDWYEPRDLKDWFNRFFSLRCLTLILIVLMLAVFEFRFDWMEKAMGSYLSTTNQQRPETGNIWETAHDTQQALESLDEITDDREAVKHKARSAADLSEIISLISDNRGVQISPDHFRELYMKLSPSIRSQILPQIALLQMLGEEQWDRTYIRKLSNQLTIYFINRGNHVISKITVPDNILVQIERRKSAFEGSLEEWGASPEGIFSIKQFFSALESLPEDVRTEVLAQPEQILNAGGRPVRVGLSPQFQTSWMDVGFELVDGAQRRVIILPAREWALGRLLSVLEDTYSGFAPIIPNPEEPTQQ